VPVPKPPQATPPEATGMTGNTPQTLRESIMRSTMGCRITSIANPILPPGTTMVLRRDMNESLIMANR